METILLDILLFLGVIWLLLGIAYLWKICLRPVPKSVDETTGKPIVTKEQVEHARHVLVGRSKPFTSPSVPETPAVSSSENSADNPSTFATQNVRKEDETESTVTPQSAPEHTDEKEEDNEMDVDYTMDEPDEDTIAREELQLEIGGRGESLIADDSLPEVSPSAILTRDLSRINGWHRNDDVLDEENETDVHETLQAIRGTQLMDYIKEATLKQEKDHQKLLAAIRKAEEAELEENNINSSSDFETNSNVESSDSDVSEDDERPLSYYL